MGDGQYINTRSIVMDQSLRHALHFQVILRVMAEQIDNVELYLRSKEMAPCQLNTSLFGVTSFTGRRSQDQFRGVHGMCDWLLHVVDSITALRLKDMFVPILYSASRKLVTQKYAAG